MPKSTVKKHCSILNYLEYEHPDLFDLLRQTCSLGFFSFRKEYNGLVFLRPEGKMLTELKRMASGDSIEEFNNTLKSLILLDNLTSISDFEDKKSDIPTLLRKKLPVKSVSSTTVTLENGAEISADEKFQARSDRDNICVFVIDKGFVPTDTPAATFSNSKRSSAKVRGGAEFKNNKRGLFEDVLNSWVMNPNRDAALETLVTICSMLEQKNSPKYKAVCSQLSYDTLASLAVVLQPYKNNGSTYLDENDIKELSAKATIVSHDLQSVYAYCSRPVAEYERHRTAGNAEAEAINTIKNTSSEISSGSNKLDIITQIKRGYSTVAGSLNNPVRREVLNTPNLAYAESELRVFSALVQNNYRSRNEAFDSLKQLFMTNCTLNQPYILASANYINSCNLGFYYSSVHLLARSNAFVFFPNVSYTSDLDDISDSTAMINLDSDRKREISNLQVYKMSEALTDEQLRGLSEALLALGRRN